MKIFALCVVKNEADVIAYTLDKASEWATKIFVLDNGSTDGTWEIINELSRANSSVIPWKQMFEPFYDGIRSKLFNSFSEEAKEGDWWCFRLDADEVYLEDPRKFLRKTPLVYDYVCKKSIDFVLTGEDLQEHDFDSHSFKENIQHIKYFMPKAWVEARFFRHKAGVIWKENQEILRLKGLVYPKTILVKHYQYRSPAQMQTRLNIRNASKADKALPKDIKPGWLHINEKSWKDLIRKRSEVIYEGEGACRYIEELNPIKYPWYKFLVKFLWLKFLHLRGKV
jgi:glycosyltransferase involved in cell wall biosynthesis